jgi:3-methylfumaryl-CoA hydratase
MWAGGEAEFLAPLHVHDDVTRHSKIADVSHKQGRTGDLVFVTVQHEYETSRGIAIRDRQDIVYRDVANLRTPASEPASAPPAGEPAEKEWRVEISPPRLFRFSALTFNGHRIHCDFPYATEVEGYEGLGVHMYGS